MKITDIGELYPPKYYLQYNHYMQKRDLDAVPLFSCIRKMMGQIENKRSVISLGSGTGYLLNWLADTLGIDLAAGLDFNLEALKVSKKKFSKSELIAGCVQRLPLKDEKFDIALMINVIEHLKRPAEGLKEAFRILKKGGRLILSTVDKNSFYTKIWIKDKTHFYEFAQDEILELVEKEGFVVKQKIFTNSIGRFNKKINYFLSKKFPADFLILAEKGI